MINKNLISDLNKHIVDFFYYHNTEIFALIKELKPPNVFIHAQSQEDVIGIVPSLGLHLIGRSVASLGLHLIGRSVLISLIKVCIRYKN